MIMFFIIFSTFSVHSKKLFFNYLRERPFFSTDFKIRTMFGLGGVGGLRSDGCSDFGGGWVGQQKSEHCSDFEIRWKKWTLP